MVRGILGNQIDCFFGDKGSFAAVFSGILIILRMMTRDSDNDNDDDSDNDNDDDSDNDKDNPLFSFRRPASFVTCCRFWRIWQTATEVGFFPYLRLVCFFPTNWFFVSAGCAPTASWRMTVDLTLDRNPPLTSPYSYKTVLTGAGSESGGARKDGPESAPWGPIGGWR